MTVETYENAQARRLIREADGTYIGIPIAGTDGVSTVYFRVHPTELVTELERNTRVKSVKMQVAKIDNRKTIVFVTGLE